MTNCFLNFVLALLVCIFALKLVSIPYDWDRSRLVLSADSDRLNLDH